MYSDIKNVQILISMLKKFNIKHLVLSSGTRNVPFVHSVEEDPFFECYSIIDERSAAFFALGLMQELNCPVAISCTSGTAIANYVSAVSEAYYQQLPLLVLTADRNEYYLDQEEDQMIPQKGLFGSLVKKSVQLPFVKDKTDFWACRRMVNEALLELDHNGKGPVHINFPIEKNVYSFNSLKLPEIKPIYRHVPGYKDNHWKEKVAILSSAKKILIIYGQNNHISEEEKYYINEFSKKYNCVISIDHLSNFQGDATIETFYFARIKKFTKDSILFPDIVITINGNSISGIKSQLKSSSGEFSHWSVRQDGHLADSTKSLTDIFQCSSLYFFKYFTDNSIDYLEENSYLNAWKEELFRLNKMLEVNIPYSDVHIVQQFMKIIPKNSNLHLANGNSVRLAQYFPKDESIIVNCHRGTNGIDGSMSSFIGQAYVSNKLSFLIIGDLSFFYDMNALWNKYVSKNVRILIINNSGAGVIQYPVYNENIKIESFDKHSAARHNTSAKGWVESQGINYLSATNKEELNEAISKFVSDESDGPMLLEVFTEKDIDVEVQHSINDINRKRTNAGDSAFKSKVKDLIINNTPEKIKQIIRDEM